jgi:CIC family chloride channel protein
MAAWLRPALAGLAIGIAGLWIPEILGIGKEVLRFATTEGVYSAFELLVLLLAKIVATALCIGFGFAGGVFSPALLIGILYGALLSHGAGALLGDLSSGLEFYAICGMVAVTSPVIGAPLTTILIVFEMTRNYELTTAVMVSVVFSNVLAYRIFGRSLFDRQLIDRGVDLSRGRDKIILDRALVSDYLSDEYVLIHPDDSLSQVKQSLVSAGATESYVVGAGGHYLGTITLQQIAALESSIDISVEQAAAHAGTETLFFEHDASVWAAMQLMEGFVGESIPVLGEDGKMLGIIHEATLIRAYIDTIRRLREEEHEVT